MIFLIHYLVAQYFVIKKHGHLRQSFNISLYKNNTCKFLTKHAKIKLVRYYEKRQGKEYDPKIKTVKYLEIMDKNIIWLIFNTASKVWKFPGHASSHSFFIDFFTKFQISTVQTLNIRNLKFEKNCPYIGGVYTYPMQSVAITFNLKVHLRIGSISI